MRRRRRSDVIDLMPDPPGSKEIRCDGGPLDGAKVRLPIGARSFCTLVTANAAWINGQDIALGEADLTPQMVTYRECAAVATDGVQRWPVFVVERGDA